MRGFAGRLLRCRSSLVRFSARRGAALQLSPVQKQEMKALYERATRAYDLGKYQEAIDEYQKAYEIGGDPADALQHRAGLPAERSAAEAIRSTGVICSASPNARNREDVERKIAS